MDVMECSVGGVEGQGDLICNDDFNTLWFAYISMTTIEINGVAHKVKKAVLRANHAHGRMNVFPVHFIVEKANA